ncbi:hypothetical protein BST61_g1282 [Cercospora zeina]
MSYVLGFGARPKPPVAIDRTFWHTLFKQDDYSDVTIKLSDRQITCHKAIICNRSEYFKKLCGKDSLFAESSQKVIELKDDNPGAVEAMLVHLYFGPYVGSDDKVKSDDWRFHADVSRVADKYLVHDLKSKATARCLQLLTAVVEPGKLCDVLFEIKSNFDDIDEVAEKAMSLRKDRIDALLQVQRFVDSLSDKEIREQFDRLRGIVDGQVEKGGWICNICERIYDNEGCKMRTCPGTTKSTKYWIPKK